ncbi:MAG: M55 family metallopeptidase [Clostridia bacterium]|nr:M55 family metallopeptidase [Clostridia bacterium]
MNKKTVIVIEADIEGASLVDSIDMMSGEGYVFACGRLAHDLNAAILGCFDGGADVRAHPALTRLDARTVTRTVTSIRGYDDMMP